jgi:predicted dehydrogenase
MLWASQVAPGNENGLKLRVYGTKGGLEWVQEDPNYLWYTPFGEPKRLITRGGAGRAGRRPRQPHPVRAIRKAISKASPTSTPKPRAPSARRAGRAASRQRA